MDYVENLSEKSERFFCFGIAFYAVVCYTISMGYVQLYEKNYQWFERRPKWKRFLLLVNKYLTLIFFGAYVGIWTFALLDKRDFREEVIFLFTIPASSLCLVSALRRIISRPRPYDEDGAGITPMIKKSRGRYSSMPSRHITSAVAISLGILQISPIIASVLLVASLVLAYTRFAVGVHYISDLFVGAAIPVAIALACFLIL